MSQPRANDVIVFRDLGQTHDSLAEGIRRAFDEANERAILAGAKSELEFFMLDRHAKRPLRMKTVVGDKRRRSRRTGRRELHEDTGLSDSVLVKRDGKRSAT